MNKKNIKLFFIVGSILLCCFFSTIAYSALYLTMDISGIAYARPVKDVRITDFKINSLSGGATVSYEEFSSNTISTKIHLVDDYSIARFDVEVTNYGNVDVGILNITNDTDADVRFDLSDYNLTEKLCDENSKCNNMAVKTFQIEFSGIPGDYELIYTFDFRTYHDVTYTDITNNNYPTEVIDGAELNVDFTEPLKRIAVYQNGEKVAYYPTVYQGSNLLLASVKGNIEIKQEEPVARLVSGKIDEAGSEVCIKNECFYIISNDGSTVSMLAKYNLHVGNTYDADNGVVELPSPTGIQSSESIGYFDGYSSSNPIVGNVAFASTNYWSSTVSSYPSYVYNANSILYSYVENYKAYLNSLGVGLIEARVITYDELQKMGCDKEIGNCSNAPSWVYSTTYWSGSATASDGVLRVGSDMHYDSNYASYDLINGVRPVIEISVDEIYDQYEVGAEKCFGDECFYVISSTYDTVTMLAKYNLHVGNSVDENRNVTSLVSPTGIQDKTAAGSILDGYSGPKYPVIGTVAFSNEYYWEDIDIYSYVPPVYVYNANSSVYTYVNNYKLYLETFGLVVDEARLIKYDELLGLGCSDWNCKNAPNWLYSTSYWTGEAYDDIGRLLVVYKCGESQHIIDFSYNIIDSVGVRPVITISKDYF